MIWIVLAALGIPLWLLLGALGALGTTLLSRRAARRVPGAFTAKLRSGSGDVSGLKPSWPRRPGVARWVHDDLLALALDGGQSVQLAAPSAARDIAVGPLGATQ